jgi:FemAB-related protein (PEP-CTERM system-associated)
MVTKLGGTTLAEPAREDARPVTATATTTRRDDDRVTVSTEVNGRDWDAFLDRHPDATVEHLWGWRDVFQRAFRHDCVYLAARRHGGVVGVLPLVRYRSAIFGRFLVSLPYFNYAGIVADDPEVSRALVAHAEGLGREHGAKHVELRHRERLSLQLPYSQVKVGVARELPQTVDDLWKTIDRKVRNQVRKAQKEGLTTVSGGVALVDDFYSVFAHNMRDLGTPVFPRALFVETARAFPRTAQFFVVRQGDRPVAGGVALRFRGTVLVPWASSLREARHLCPNMLLYWSMMEWAVNEGCGVFDFGRSSVGAGTQQFKEQWGGVARPLHTEYILLNGGSVPNQGTTNPRMQVAINIWQRLPLKVASLLGPRLIAHLA